MTPFQSKVLHRVLEQTEFPNTELRILLAKRLGMKPRTVQIWFQNQRQKKKTQQTSPPTWQFSPDKSGMLTPPLMPLDILASAALNEMDP